MPSIFPAHTITLKVDEATLAARKAKWSCPEPKIRTGYLARYAKLVSSADKGAILEYPFSPAVLSKQRGFSVLLGRPVISVPSLLYTGRKEMRWRVWNTVDCPIRWPTTYCWRDGEQLTVSGVEEVESFDENTIVMLTVKGTLVVRGEDSAY